MGTTSTTALAVNYCQQQECDSDCQHSCSLPPDQYVSEPHAHLGLLSSVYVNWYILSQSLLTFDASYFYFFLYYYHLLMIYGFNLKHALCVFQVMYNAQRSWWLFIVCFRLCITRRALWWLFIVHFLLFQGLLVRTGTCSIKMNQIAIVRHVYIIHSSKVRHFGLL